MSQDSNDGCLALFIIVAILFVAYLYATANAISVDAAVERFYELSDAEEIEVIRHTNNNYFFGDVHDVTFELLVDGHPAQGRCTSGTWSEMVCRFYSEGD